MKQFPVFVLLLLFTAPAVAQDIEFAWDLSSDDALLGAKGGYCLYSSKQSGVYTDSPVLTVPPGTSIGSIPRPALGRYYFVATAFDSEGKLRDGVGADCRECRNSSRMFFRKSSIGSDDDFPTWLCRIRGR